MKHKFASVLKKDNNKIKPHSVDKCYEALGGAAEQTYGDSWEFCRQMLEGEGEVLDTKLEL